MATTRANLPSEAGNVSVFDSPDGMIKVHFDCFGFYMMADDWDSDCGSADQCIAKLDRYNAKHVGWEKQA